jgi:hypothetical protein
MRWPNLFLGRWKIERKKGRKVYRNYHQIISPAPPSLTTALPFVKKYENIPEKLALWRQSWVYGSHYVARCCRYRLTATSWYVCVRKLKEVLKSRIGWLRGRLLCQLNWANSCDQIHPNASKKISLKIQTRKKKGRRCIIRTTRDELKHLEFRSSICY